MTAALSIPRLKTGGFLEFLRRELVPTPGRWQGTLRLTLACVAATVPIMAFHLKEPLLVMIGIFIIVKEDATSTLLGSVLGILGATLGCGLLLLFYVCVADLTWLRVLCVPVFIALGLFINRVLTLGPLGSSIGVPLALGMVIPDVVTDTEYLSRIPFYLWWALVLGLVINVVAEYLLNPQTSRSLLMRGLVLRLSVVEALLRRLAAGEKAGARPPVLGELAVAGVVNQLRLLKLASVAEPLLKQRQARLRAQFILIDRMVTAAAMLEIHGVAFLDEEVQRRLRQLADECQRWRTAINDGRPPVMAGAGRESAPAFMSENVPPPLSEMERVAELMQWTFSDQPLPDELKPAPSKGGALVPDAFTNPIYLQSAIKGALAGFICYLIFTLAAYQGIYTSVVTCIVCSLATVGAANQKGLLRFFGSVVGGALGVVTLVYIFPRLDSLGGFWFPFSAVTALAAYVTLGGPRISYCGYQISLAFNKCVLQSYGPYTELRVIRDRLVGILLGLVVFGLINNWLWPARALETTRSRLASVLRSLAKLAGLPDENENLTRQLTNAYSVRLEVYQDMASVRESLESSKFEPDAGHRDRLERRCDEAQALFLHLLAIIQHRPDLRPLAVPEPLRAASARFRSRLADLIDAIAERLESKPARPLPDLLSALADLERIAAAHISAATDPRLAAQLRARLELYREATPIALKLGRWQME